MNLNRSALIGLTLACLNAAALMLLLPPRVTATDPVGSCAGDLNGDRAVDDRDVATLLANFGQTESTADPPNMWARGDLNDDGRIDAADLSVLLKTYGCREFAPQGFALAGPPPDALPGDLEPWRPGSFFTAEFAESRGGTR